MTNIQKELHINEYLFSNINSNGPFFIHTNSHLGLLIFSLRIYFAQFFFLMLKLWIALKKNCSRSFSVCVCRIRNHIAFVFTMKISYSLCQQMKRLIKFEEHFWKNTIRKKAMKTNKLINQSGLLILTAYSLLNVSFKFISFDSTKYIFKPKSKPEVEKINKQSCEKFNFSLNFNKNLNAEK